MPYPTLDIYQATFLHMEGHRILAKRRVANGLYEFVFDDLGRTTTFGRRGCAGITLNRVQIMDWNREGANDELVTQPVSFKAFYNPTDQEQSTVIVRNLTAEYDVPVSD